MRKLSPTLKQLVSSIVLLYRRHFDQAYTEEETWRTFLGSLTWSLPKINRKWSENWSSAWGGDPPRVLPSCNDPQGSPFMCFHLWFSTLFSGTNNLVKNGAPSPATRWRRRPELRVRVSGRFSLRLAGSAMVGSTTVTEPTHRLWALL